MKRLGFLPTVLTFPATNFRFSPRSAVTLMIDVDAGVPEGRTSFHARCVRQCARMEVKCGDTRCGDMAMAMPKPPTQRPCVHPFDMPIPGNNQSIPPSNMNSPLR